MGLFTPAFHRGFSCDALVIDGDQSAVPLVLDAGCWAGHSIYPETKMSEERMVKLVQQYGHERIIVNSAADWGVSDPLKVPKTVAEMRKDLGFLKYIVTARKEKVWIR